MNTGSNFISHSDSKLWLWQFLKSSLREALGFSDLHSGKTVGGFPLKHTSHFKAFIILLSTSVSPGAWEKGILRQNYASIMLNGFSILNCSDVSVVIKMHSYKFSKSLKTFVQSSNILVSRICMDFRKSWFCSSVFCRHFYREKIIIIIPVSGALVENELTLIKIFFPSLT